MASTNLYLRQSQSNISDLRLRSDVNKIPSGVKSIEASCQISTAAENNFKIKKNLENVVNIVFSNNINKLSSIQVIQVNLTTSLITTDSSLKRKLTLSEAGVIVTQTPDVKLSLLKNVLSVSSLTFTTEINLLNRYLRINQLSTISTSITDIEVLRVLARLLSVSQSVENTLYTSEPLIKRKTGVQGFIINSFISVCDNLKNRINFYLSSTNITGVQTLLLKVLYKINSSLDLIFNAVVDRLKNKINPTLSIFFDFISNTYNLRNKLLSNINLSINFYISTLFLKQKYFIQTGSNIQIEGFVNLLKRRLSAYIENIVTVESNILLLYNTRNISTNVMLQISSIFDILKNRKDLFSSDVVVFVVNDVNFDFVIFNAQEVITNYSTIQLEKEMNSSITKILRIIQKLEIDREYFSSINNVVGDRSSIQLEKELNSRVN